MKTSAALRPILALALVLICSNSLSAATIWSDDFESYADNTTAAIDNNTDNPSADWSRTLTYSEDYFRVEDNDDFTPITGARSFAGKETDGASTWTSESVAITGYTNVSVSVNYNEVGNQEGGDYILIQYELNGSGTWVTLSNGYHNNDINGPTETASITGLSGATIQLRVIVDCNGNDEIWFFDDVLVEGTPAGPTCSTCYSVMDGNIDDALTWSNVSGGANGFSLITDGTGSIVVEGGHTVNLNTDFSLTNVTVGATGNGIINYTNNNTALTIENGGSLIIASGSSVDENGQDNARIIIDDGGFTYQMEVNDASTGLHIDDIYILNDANIEITGSGTISVGNDILFMGSRSSIENTLSGTFTVGDDMIWGDDDGDEDNVFNNQSSIQINGDVLFLRQTDDDSLFNQGSISVIGNVEWEDDGMTGAAANVDGYIENNGSFFIGNDLHLGADDCVFYNNGALSIGGQIFYFEHTDLTGLNTSVSSTTSVGTGIYFQTDLNAATNNFINNAGNLSIGSSIESDQGQISIHNSATGIFSVGGNVDQDHSGGGMSLTNLGNMSVGGDLRLEDNASSLSVDNDGTFSFDDVEPSNGNLDISNSGTISMSGAFLAGEVDGDSDFINEANARWNHSGTGNDPDTRMTCNATGNTFNYNRAGDQELIDVIGNVYYHLEITNSGTKTTIDDIDIEGNLIISGSAEFDVEANNNDIEIAGNWVNTSNSGFTTSAESVTFDGLADQSITCSTLGLENYYDLLINKSNGSYVLLNNNVEVNHYLNFLGTNAYLNINGNNLNLNTWNDGNIMGYDEDEFIIVDQVGYINFEGIDAGETINIPMGLSSGITNYALADIMLTDPGTGAFAANLCDQVQLNGGICTGTPIFSDAVNYTWNLVSTSTNAEVKLHWDTSTELSLFDRTNCSVMHFNGILWEDFTYGGATPESGSLYSQSATVNGFSPYAVQDAANPLPIELLSFNVELHEGKVRIKWVTRSEINNDYFTVERSADGFTYETVCMVAGAGFSSTEKQYAVIDQNPYEGYSYYRLKQTDFDNSSKYSEIALILVEEASEGDAMMEVSMFPNPTSSDKFFLSTKCGKKDEVLIVLYSASGAEVYSKFVVVQQGETITAIDLLGKVSPGVYTVVGTSKNELFKQRIIVK